MVVDQRAEGSVEAVADATSFWALEVCASQALVVDAVAEVEVASALLQALHLVAAVGAHVVVVLGVGALVVAVVLLPAAQVR